MCKRAFSGWRHFLNDLCNKKDMVRVDVFYVLITLVMHIDLPLSESPNTRIKEEHCLVSVNVGLHVSVNVGLHVSVNVGLHVSVNVGLHVSVNVGLHVCSLSPQTVLSRMLGRMQTM